MMVRFAALLSVIFCALAFFSASAQDAKPEKAQDANATLEAKPENKIPPVFAELEKLGRKFHLALKLTKDPRVKHLKCGCHGNYADDCIVNQVTKNRIYIVATNDKDLRRRIRKIPGVPILYLHQFKFQVERLPDLDFGPRHF